MLKPSAKVRHWGRRADPEGEDAVCVSECDVWGPNKAGDLDVALSSGAAGQRSSGWRAGGQLALWDGMAVR